MFPNANSRVIRNEDGEPVGFEAYESYEPDYDSFDEYGFND